MRNSQSGLKMRDPAHLTTRIPAYARAVAAFLATAGLLLQIILGPPLATRMWSSAAPPAWPAALCRAMPLHDPVDQSPAPALPHQHDDCPICQSNALPLGLLPAIFLVLVAINYVPPQWWTTRASVAPAWPFTLYSSRAPPARA